MNLRVGDGTVNDMEQRAAARQFVANRKGRGDEKQETQAFWIQLLRTVYGVEKALFITV